MNKNKPRIGYFDIETSPNQVLTWGGAMYDQQVIKVVKDWHILSFSWKWEGGKTFTFSLPDFKSYKKDPSNDKELVQKLWELFDEADIIVAHNGDRFDIRKANSRFLFHKLGAPSPYKTVDTLKVARKYFNLTSYRLNDLAQLLGLGTKESTGGFELWEKCMAGDPAAWRKMERYNKQDVELLYQVDMRLRSWHTSRPNMGLYLDKEGRCPCCGGTELIKRGFSYAKVGKYQQYRCLTCGRWPRGRELIQTNVTIV